MNTKILIAIIFIFLGISAHGQKHGKITANIKGLENDTVCIYQYPLTDASRITKDTIVAQDNRFTFKTPKEPTAFAIIPYQAIYKRGSGGFYIAQSKFIELFTRADEQIDIVGDIEKYYINYNINGNDVSTDLAQLRKTYKTPAIEAVKLELGMDSLRQVGQSNEVINKLFESRNQYFDQIYQSKSQYVDQNLDKDLSAYLISRFSLESFANYYPKLTKNIREGLFEKILQQQYQRYQKYQATNTAEKQLTAGTDAPNFSLLDNNGQTISLSDFKGKLIVLDFWGTWCGPCIQEIPILKSFHNDYGSDVALISIACNDKETEWKKAIAKLGLDWTQLINSEEHNVSVLYGVKAYPTKIIIDKDLKIIKRFIGAKEDFFIAMEDILKKK